MSYLRPFFVLLGRASVFWLGSLVIVTMSFLLAALSQPDEPPAAFVNAGFLAVFGFPAAAGWLAGAVIQEFQHTTFAWPLPGVQRRLATGFLLTGIGVACLVTLLAAPADGAGNHPLLLLAVGVASFCLGGVFLDPLRPWLSSLSLLAVLAFVVNSRSLAELCRSHPLQATAVAFAVGAYGLSRLFARSTFRRKPFSLTSPFPGAFALERSAEYERARMAQRKPRRSGWKADYLGASSWRWARAATHETFGAFGWRDIPAVLGRLWAFGLLFAVYAWADMADVSFTESLAKTLHEAIICSPHVAPFGELGKGRDSGPLVALWIGGFGVLIALWSPSALKTGLAYPLSRRQRAAVACRAGLIDAAIFVAAVGGTLLLIASVSGWVAGYEQRFDFVPAFVRPLLGTLILMPLAHWAGLHLALSARKKGGNGLVKAIVGVIGFVATVVAWDVLTTGLFVAPVAGLGISMLLLLITHTAYRQGCASFFASRDLQ